jgi:hypothetical protein
VISSVNAFPGLTGSERGDFKSHFGHPPLQCRSNPVSADRLPKTGISSVVAGDFRQIGLGCREIGRLETTSRIAKTRRWRAFLLNLAPSSHTSELSGWGGRDRTSEWWNQNPLPARFARPNQQQSCSELTGIRARTERCCGGRDGCGRLRDPALPADLAGRG